MSIRYEEVYVLICHHTEASSASDAKAEGSRIPIDQKILDSVRSLIVFCASLNHYVTVTPLLIPSLPESVLKWVLALANKYYVTTPWSNEPKLAPSNGCATLPNEGRLPRAKHGSAPPDEPTVWELFLRRAGLNPFAASIVLMQPPLQGSYSTSPSNGTYPTVAGSVPDVAERHMIPSPHDNLSLFVAMLPRDRRRHFAQLLGERVLARVESQLDRVWEANMLMSDNRRSTASSAGLTTYDPSPLHCYARNGTSRTRSRMGF